MAITRIDIDSFLVLSGQHLVIDVRSEGEFAHAHFPGAMSMPLFDNEERKVVGTAYKKESKKKAIKLGLNLFGKKMVSMVEAVEGLLAKTAEEPHANTVIVYCWRGGMRSGGVGWLLDLYGFKVYTLIGGYKTFRRWSIQQLQKDYPLKVIGGYTGSGKTCVLNELRKLQQEVIDLEDLAKHKGSAFGSIGMPAQPSQEMFENLLALELFKASPLLQSEEDGARTPAIWIEDESQRIGLVNLPTTFYLMMRSKPIYFLDIPFKERLKHIIAEYGNCDKQELINATNRIQKRLGGLETKTAIQCIMEDKVAPAFSILLKYYDKQYTKGLHTRSNLDVLLHQLKGKKVDAAENALQIINTQTEIHA